MIHGSFFILQGRMSPLETRSKVGIIIGPGPQVPKDHLVIREITGKLLGFRGPVDFIVWHMVG
jgi:anthranilate/para-aminobenzoate synthase component II